MLFKSLDLAPKASFGQRLPHCSAGQIKVHQEPVLVKATGGLSSSWNCWLKEGAASGYFVTTVKVLVCGTGCSEQNPMQGLHLDDSKSPDKAQNPTEQSITSKGTWFDLCTEQTHFLQGAWQSHSFSMHSSNDEILNSTPSVLFHSWAVLLKNTTSHVS